MNTDALQQIGYGLNNLHSAFLAHQVASEKRWASTDAKLDRHYSELYAKLSDVCDRGGQDHDAFKDRLHALEMRMAEQEARYKGRADVLRPILGWAMKNWAVIVFALYVGWDNFVAPALHQATAAPAHISGRL